ncbi:hypothetical protein HBH98_127520 [Parastagonospora nodorum]|nr:hypothetical protein HBH53_034790 [Parastagonospora nodorum]KAH3984349.1 hypothetical protein HBH51_024920 [Parastagonospora nodorum]KAH4036946.1 hypothetical protein HBI09_079420 [Parastagonospora nodorum]KAH4051647.1 hypothetical protein HBH49_106210 [Parastagonospora nodorum]KAH4344730.1 hypothetical protein HBH98_127520 [Parastagonospora nodorum]
MLPLRTKHGAVDNTTPDRYRFAQRIRHTLPSPSRVHNHSTTMVLNNIEQLQIQPPQTEPPLAHMTIRALE